MNEEQSMHKLIARKSTLRPLLLLLALLAAMLVHSGVRAEALLGAGDIIKVSVFGSPDLTLETRIPENGRISMPLLGEVAIGGLTPAAAEARIASGLDEGKFLRKPQVNILVTLMQSQQVSVLGQVKNPGRYPIDGVRNLADVVALAGGINTDGSDDITLIRNHDGQPTKQNVNLGALMRGADAGSVPTIAGGDVVFVDRAPRFYIYGEVQHPGSYKLERNLNVLQALSLGGGLTPRGTERGIRIKRRDAHGAIEIVEARQDDSVRVDDVIFVRESLF
jgi:polysaccharide export outer membrane protein